MNDTTINFDSTIDFNTDIEEFVIVVSITDNKWYSEYFESCLGSIGIPYTLIKTNPDVSITNAYNSIIKYNNLYKSKYTMFVHQDIKFLEEDWGKRIVEFCNKLPDLGYAGTECITEKGDIIGYGYAFRGKTKWGRSPKEPIKVQTCDGGVGVIPTKLFLERQFDEQFPWFPVQEDYACWVQYEKNMSVYCLPIISWHRGGGKIFAKNANKGSQWRYIANKWNRIIYTTGKGRGGIKPNEKKRRR